MIRKKGKSVKIFRQIRSEGLQTAKRCWSLPPITGIMKAKMMKMKARRFLPFLMLFLSSCLQQGGESVLAPTGPLSAGGGDSRATNNPTSNPSVSDDREDGDVVVPEGTPVGAGAAPGAPADIFGGETERKGREGTIARQDTPPMAGPGQIVDPTCFCGDRSNPLQFSKPSICPLEETVGPTNQSIATTTAPIASGGDTVNVSWIGCTKRDGYFLPLLLRPSFWPLPLLTVPDGDPNQPDIQVTAERDGTVRFEVTAGADLARFKIEASGENGEACGYLYVEETCTALPLFERRPPLDLRLDLRSLPKTVK